jgi:hypothetical protein
MSADAAFYEAPALLSLSASMRSGSTIYSAILVGAIQLGIAGCYYPSNLPPPAVAKTQTRVKVPYDLTWEAVHKVIADNQFKVLGDDPNDGIIEAEAHSFTLADADCGQMKSIGSRYTAEPDPGGSAVYNFKVQPAGPEATSLTLNATYSTPLHVPLHPVTDFQCVSRGTQEARLLNEIDAAAQAEKRPTPEGEKPAQQLVPGRPSLLRPDFLKKPGVLSE